MPDEPVPDDAAGLRAANARLRGLLAAAHGITALDAISSAIAGKPWLPPLPTIADASSRTP